MKVAFISLGCAKNLVDTEFILGVLRKAGITLVNEIGSADVIMINTCGFIKPAKEETLATIEEMHGYGKKIIVLGCYAERYRNELENDAVHREGHHAQGLSQNPSLLENLFAIDP